MSKIAVMTDSNAGITQAEAVEKGIYLVPMPFYIDEKLYYEDLDLSQEQFYEFLEQGCSLSTSQPSPGDLMDEWDELLRRYDQVIYIPMSSGLSNSCQTAMMLADEDPYEGRVYVIDNQRISVTQKSAVFDALALVQAGKTAEEIRDILLGDKLKASIYIMVDTLQYLKKGGRITPAAAMLGTMLKLKPVLQIQGERLDAYAKVRGVKQARRTMIEALKKDMETRFAREVSQGEMELAVAYTRNLQDALAFKEELSATFPQMPLHFCDPLSLSVSCHIGPGALAAALVKRSVR